jgi:hypothetical protein
MTPQHMDTMCARVVAVEEDMAPVEHGRLGLVHEGWRVSRGPGRVVPRGRA